MARKAKSASAPDLSAEGLTAKAKKYFRARAIGKANYARADRLLQEIVAAIRPGMAIPLDDAGKKAVLVDLYADGKLVVFRAHGIRRYDLEIEE